jgi:hypothetical protein
MTDCLYIIESRRGKKGKSTQLFIYFGCKAEIAESGTHPYKHTPLQSYSYSTTTTQSLALGMTRKVVRIAIIGAGASGLAQLKQVLDAFNRPDVQGRTDLEVVVLEKQSEVGGVWYA